MNKKGLMIAVTSISTSDSLSLFLSFPIPRPYLHDTISDQKTHQQNQSQHKIQKNQINQNRKWDEQHIFISVFRSERSINSERERERNYQLRCIPVTMNAGPGHASRLLHHRWTFLLLGVITAPFSFLLLFFSVCHFPTTFHSEQKTETNTQSNPNTKIIYKQQHKKPGLNMNVVFHQSLLRSRKTRPKLSVGTSWGQRWD